MPPVDDPAGPRRLEWTREYTPGLPLAVEGVPRGKGALLAQSRIV